MRILSFGFLMLLFLVNTAYAHIESGIAPPTFVQIIWAVHSWTHWLVWVGFIYTCYYFRFLSGSLSGHPSRCMMTEKSKNNVYQPENKIKLFHRIFVWLMIVWALAHLSELVGAQLGYSELPVYSLAEILPGEELWEWVYIISTLLVLASCHYIRYLGGSTTKCFSCLALGKSRHKVFSFQSFLNNYHGVFFWIAIISSIILLLSGGHL